MTFNIGLGKEIFQKSRDLPDPLHVELVGSTETSAAFQNGKIHQL